MAESEEAGDGQGAAVTPAPRDDKPDYPTARQSDERWPDYAWERNRELGGYHPELENDLEEWRVWRHLHGALHRRVRALLVKWLSAYCQPEDTVARNSINRALANFLVLTRERYERFTANPADAPPLVSCELMEIIWLSPLGYPPSRVEDFRNGVCALAAEVAQVSGGIAWSPEEGVIWDEVASGQSSEPASAQPPGVRPLPSDLEPGEEEKLIGEFAEKWRLYTRAERYAFRREAAAQNEGRTGPGIAGNPEIKRRIIHAALIEALDGQTGPHVWKPRKPVAGYKPSAAPIFPANLSRPHHRAWLRHRTLGLATDSLFSGINPKHENPQNAHVSEWDFSTEDLDDDREEYALAERSVAPGFEETGSIYAALNGLASPKQRQILKLFAQGRKLAQIARELGNEPPTVRVQWGRLMKKARGAKLTIPAGFEQLD